MSIKIKDVVPGFRVSYLTVKEVKGEKVICECDCGRYPVYRSLSSILTCARAVLGVSSCKKCMRIIRNKKYSPHSSRPPGFKLPPKDSINV